MSYFLDLFSPETYEAFLRSDQSVSGFRTRQKNMANRVEPGDKLICYMTKLSRWFGMLEVVKGPYRDDTPIFYPNNDSIRRAFEVEHTTSVYSGILRMADLLALQSNMDISLHIVAPLARREKVLQELRRPVFSLLERGPLSETCTYVCYDSVRELAQQPNLAHLKETVLDEYEEAADE